MYINKAMNASLKFIEKISCRAVHTLQHRTKHINPPVPIKGSSLQARLMFEQVVM